MTLQNEKFEELVSRQLNAELEPQRGKALAAFRAHYVAESTQNAPASARNAPVGPTPVGTSPGRTRQMRLLWAGIPSLLAASIAVVVTLQLTRPQPISVPPEGTNKVAANAASAKTGSLVFDAPVDQIFIVQNVPNGVMPSDAMPLRFVRQQDPRAARLIDPNDRSPLSLSEPVERVGYIQIRP